MSDASTIRMLEMYLEEASSPMFLSGFFQSPPRNFHDTEDVEIDILRDDEDVAIVIQDISAGSRSNESNLYTNKRWTPPIYDEDGTITAFKLNQRQAGVDPFQNPEFAANAFDEASRVFRKLERKIRRAIELMASQVLQTGILTLVDGAGTTLYSLDFKPKATHFPTAGADWGGGSETPLADLESLSNIIRQDGKKTPNKLIFGAGAFENFISDADVIARLDNRRFFVGEIRPQARGEGAKFQGQISIGHYQYEMWTYDGFFKDPQTGNPTTYVTDDLVIMMSDGGRLDLSFGSIPFVAPPDPRAASFMPPRISDGGAGLDLTTNAYVTPDNKHLKVSAGTRPLTIPTAIDTFGALNTIA